MTSDSLPLKDLRDRWLGEWLAEVQARHLTLYPHQEEAILGVLEGAHVILNTPTGSGKSLVSEAFLRMPQGLTQRPQQGFYVSPIKALVNEKFLELCSLMGPQSVGLMTGDATVHAEAPILCCTAEVLSQLALRGVTRPAVVVLDEFHYVADPERGIHWQTPILLLRETQFLLMSATLGDVRPWMERLEELNKGRGALWVHGAERPVPLDFGYLQTPLQESLLELHQTHKTPVYVVHFSQRAATERAQDLLSLDFTTREEKRVLVEKTPAESFQSPFGRVLQRYLRHGIGVHHAGLLPKYRLLVERLAREGLLKVICGTDTLGVGINVPIRSVLFTQLCKFDGRKTALLTVREFHQIAGRAGRRGFDDKGYVWVQAPEHVIENLRAEQKAATRPGGSKKIVKKKPPERGYVAWDEKTLERLQTSDPESLTPSFWVDTGMLLQLLARPEGGVLAAREWIRRSWTTSHAKQQARRQAFHIVRGLLERGILELLPKEERRAFPQRTPVRLHTSLQEDFSLHHALSVYLFDAAQVLVATPDRDPFALALDLLSLVEAILEDPIPVLRAQGFVAKNAKIRELREKGLSRDEIDLKLAELQEALPLRQRESGMFPYPKPLEEFLENTVPPFLEAHPWVTGDQIRPKSVARDLLERGLTFAEYVRDLELERVEGTLLRYLHQVIHGARQNIPESLQSPDFLACLEVLRATVARVDQSLEQEWKQFHPDGSESFFGSSPRPLEEKDRMLPPSRTQQERVIRIQLHQAMVSGVRLLAREKWDLLEEVFVPSSALADLPGSWKAYLAAHPQGLAGGQRLPHPELFSWKPSQQNPPWSSGVTTLRIPDRDAHDDWELSAQWHLEGASLLLEILHLGPIGGMPAVE